MDALIIGAGPSGLTTACELALHGIDCRVIDKRLERSRESRALGVQARTLEIFDQLGIQEGLDARGPSVILIRPDGYIAHRSEPIDADAVIHYLDSLFL